MIPTGLRHPSLSYIQDIFNSTDFVNNLILYMPLGIALGGLGIVLRDEFHDLLQVGQRAIGDQDLPSHPRIIAGTSEIGRTRPAATSAMPRSSAASSSSASGSGSAARSSAVSSALS